MNLSPSAPPTLTPMDADALEMFYWYPFNADEVEEVVPDYSDVADE
jgi:hypothetical protein